MLTVAALAAAAVGLVVLLRAAPRMRVLGLALAASSAMLMALQLRAADRELVHLRGDIANRDSLLDLACDSLAFQLRAAVNDYRTLSQHGVEPVPVDALKLQNYYLHSLSERTQFARMCVANGAAARWFACIPPTLSEQTLAKIEQAATAIQEHKPCD